MWQMTNIQKGSLPDTHAAKIIQWSEPEWTGMLPGNACINILMQGSHTGDTQVHAKSVSKESVRISSWVQTKITLLHLRRLAGFIVIPWRFLKADYKFNSFNLILEQLSGKVYSI